MSQSPLARCWKGQWRTDPGKTQGVSPVRARRPLLENTPRPPFPRQGALPSAGNLENPLHHKPRGRDGLKSANSKWEGGSASVRGQEDRSPSLQTHSHPPQHLPWAPLCAWVPRVCGARSCVLLTFRSDPSGGLSFPIAKGTEDRRRRRLVGGRHGTLFLCQRRWLGR